MPQEPDHTLIGLFSCDSTSRSPLALNIPGVFMRRLVLALTTASLLACGDSTGPGSVVGTWNLRTVNGSQLPYTVYLVQPTYRLEIMSARFIADDDGTYTGAVTLRETNNGQVTTTTDSDFGTWSQANNTLTITDSEGAVSTATISGNTITLSEQGFVSVYRRE
jgi:lipocalin-like protein